MPTNLPDQNWTVPALADLADNPLAFTDFAADVQNTVVLRYPNTATRDAFNAGRVAGDISFTTGNTWYDRWTGSKWLPVTPIQAFKAANQIVNNSTVFVNATDLVVPIPTINSNWTIEALLAYNSSAVADIKFTFTAPAGAGFLFGGAGAATGETVTSGNGNWTWLTSQSYGGGADAFVAITGSLLSGATLGNLQLQFAQNTLEVSNTTLFMRSWLRLTAVS